MARLSRLRLAGLLMTLLAGPCLAQQFPSRPIRYIVPFAPGGNIDVTTRIISEAMARTLGQPAVIDNKAGAGGAIGAEIVARAEPDGYTLLGSASGALVVSPRILPKISYNLQSFAPIGLVAIAPLVVAVRAESPLKDFAALLAAAKADPGRISFGHSGNGTSNHVVILQLQRAAGVQFNVIPYKGSAPALMDLLGGQIEVIVDQTTSSLSQIKAGKLRPLAVTTAARTRDLPDVPALSELGLKGFEVTAVSGLLAPANTPAPVLARLNAALSEALADPTVQKRMIELGLEIHPGSIADYQQALQREDAIARSLADAGLLKGE